MEHPVTNGGVRKLADGTFLPLVKIDGGFGSPPPGEPSFDDAHEAADRSRELSGVPANQRRREYWASPIVVDY